VAPSPSSTTWRKKNYFRIYYNNTVEEKKTQKLTQIKKNDKDLISIRPRCCGHPYSSDSCLS
jgi:hypothetical protein